MATQIFKFRLDYRVQSQHINVRATSWIFARSYLRDRFPQAGVVFIGGVRAPALEDIDLTKAEEAVDQELSHSCA